MTDLDKLALTLDEALLSRKEIPPLTKTYGDLTLEQAYEVQRAGIALRLKRGERIVGFKMGLTSEAKRQQMSLTLPIYGVLTDAMRSVDTLLVRDGIHPKIEPEIAFMTARTLHGTISRDEALDACSGVAPALEILDSRFAGFKYFSLPDVVADNCSSWRFALGRFNSARDVGDLRMRMRIDGRLRQEAQSSAISGHPAESLVQLVAMLAAHGQSLPAGSVVLAGAATLAEPLKPGMEITLDVEELGDVTLLAD